MGNNREMIEGNESTVIKEVTKRKINSNIS